MTRAYSLAFKRKIIERLTGKDALSASQLSRQTGVRQQNLSRWLEEARSLSGVASDTVPRWKWTVEQKARMLAKAANLSGEALCAYLEGEGALLVRKLAPEPAYQQGHCNRYVENSGNPFECRQDAGFPAKRHDVAVANRRERYQAEIQQIGLTVGWVTTNLD